jgi:hypothetical protein
MSEQIVIELIRLIPGLLWLVFLAILIGLFYKPIREELIPRMSGFRAWGVEVDLLGKELDRAANAPHLDFLHGVCYSLPQATV